MITITVQLLVFILVVFSTLLVIGIPVTLASPEQWEKSKNLIYTGAGIWAGLIIVTGVINSFII
uniref:Photosystem II reaction center protein Z n=1 Tax=Pterocladia lucida TaxID=31408 RepID=A0A6M3WVX3_PTELU|nr:PsbZ [Pterocladia lucida]